MANTRLKSGILKLPEAIVREIDRMLVEVGEERRTYDEIVGWVQAQGQEVSRSALSRYFKNVQALEKVKLMTQQVKAIIDETGQSPLELEEGASKLGAVIMMEVFQEALRGEDKVDVKHIGRLMGDFAKLQNASVARERLKMDFKKKAAKAVESIEKKTKKSLDAETLRVIKEEIYGIA